MNKLSKREKVLLLILAVALVVYGYFTFVMNPLMTSISQLNLEEETLSMQKQEMELIISQKDLYRQMRETAEADYAVKFQDYPEYMSDIEVSAYITALCLDSNLTVNTYSMTRAEEPKNPKDGEVSYAGIFDIYNIALKMTGTNDDILHLLDEIGKDKSLALTSLILPHDTTTGVTMNISIYVKKPVE